MHINHDLQLGAEPFANGFDNLVSFAKFPLANDMAGLAEGIYLERCKAFFYDIFCGLDKIRR